MRSVKELDTGGKRVLVRCDFNVPLTEAGEIADDFRIRRTIPTLELLRSQGARVVCMSHLGRREERLTLKPAADRLGELLGTTVRFTADCVGPEAEAAVSGLGQGEVLLLENLRFHKEEEEGSSSFAAALARLGDLYVNDAFAASHRPHASLAELPRILPSAAGLLLAEESAALSGVRDNPARPFVLVVGGIKVETKAKFLSAMGGKADSILIGNLLARAGEQGRVQLPHSPVIVAPVDGRPDGANALDIGPQTLELFQEKVKGAGTVLWTGPLGRVEDEEYAVGSLELARAILESGAYSVAGGGHLGSFLGAAGLRDRFSYASTGGSAMLAFVAGEQLPGITALEG